MNCHLYCHSNLFEGYLSLSWKAFTWKGLKSSVLPLLNSGLCLNNCWKSYRCSLSSSWPGGGGFRRCLTTLHGFWVEANLFDLLLACRRASRTAKHWHWWRVGSCGGVFSHSTDAGLRATRSDSLRNLFTCGKATNNCRVYIGWTTTSPAGSHTT